MQHKPIVRARRTEDPEFPIELCINDAVQVPLEVGLCDYLAELLRVDQSAWVPIDCPSVYDRLGPSVN